MDTGIALLQYCGIPGYIEVDQHRPTLQVKPYPTGISRNKNLNPIIIAKAIHQISTLGRRHTTV